MKKLIFTLAMTLTSVAVIAQNGAGTFSLQPRVGMNISTLTDADKAIVDLCFGVEAEYMLARRLSLAGGLMFSNQGAKYNGNPHYTADLDYINVPIVANFYVVPGLAIKAGVQPGFKIKAKAKMDDGTIDLQERYHSVSTLVGEDLVIRTFDLAIPVGASYEYKNITLDARYNWGLVRVTNIGSIFYNRVFELTLGYKFAL